MDENVPKLESENAATQKNDYESLLDDYTAFQKWYRSLFRKVSSSGLLAPAQKKAGLV